MEGVEETDKCRDWFQEKRLAMNRRVIIPLAPPERDDSYLDDLKAKMDQVLDCLQLHFVH